LLYAFPSCPPRKGNIRREKRTWNLEAGECVLNIPFHAIQGGLFRIPGVACGCQGFLGFEMCAIASVPWLKFSE